jgi:demethylmenaquinone methyltransferase/2-methoxy-6-polyprenyl-1,4-benzoquinol methylase
MPFDHFGSVAKIYERSGKFEVTEEFSKLINLTPESRLIDVGGGTGRVAAALMKMTRQVVVADPSRKMLFYANQKGLATICSTAEALPFTGESFDRAIMVDAFHHVSNQQATAQELWRIIKPGGRILIIEPDIRRLFVKLLAIFEKLLLMQSHILHYDQIKSIFQGKDARISCSFSENIVSILIEKAREM